MSNDPGLPRDEMTRSDIVSALRVSVVSVVWTLISSVLAVSIGIYSHETDLVAFGAVGIVDAIGSVALTYQFLHSLRHEVASDRLEKLSHRVVLVGLIVVGGSAAVGGAFRVAAPHSNSSSDLGLLLAAASLCVLVVLSRRKQQIARRISSSALRSDGQLSAVGALLAGITLAGTAVQRGFHWNWADGVATIFLGTIAMGLGISSWRSSNSPGTSDDPPLASA
jgi:divalent metal cation (Fe/Co/Zn/Cd) transporter